MKTFLQWVSDSVGQSIDLDGMFGAQCVDLVDSMTRNVWGYECPRGNAIDFARPGFMPRMEWVENGPRNAPPPSAIVVWGPTPSLGISDYGHVAVCLVGTGMEILSIDQNWGGVQRVAVIRHSYKGVMGWWI